MASRFHRQPGRKQKAVLVSLKKSVAKAAPGLAEAPADRANWKCQGAGNDYGVFAVSPKAMVICTHRSPRDGVHMAVVRAGLIEKSRGVDGRDGELVEGDGRVLR